MTKKMSAELKSQFVGTDPYDQNSDLVDALLYAASATETGQVELATNGEALAGSDAARAVTPAALAAVTGGFKVISFDGKNGAGACTAVGAVVGDKVVTVAGLSSGALGEASSSFESVVTVADQIQQTAVGDLSTLDYLAFLVAVA